MSNNDNVNQLQQTSFAAVDVTFLLGEAFAFACKEAKLVACVTCCSCYVLESAFAQSMLLALQTLFACQIG